MTKLTWMSTVAALATMLAATPAVADKGGVPNEGNGKGSEQAAQPATPAEPGAPGNGAQPATPAQPAPKAKAKSKPKAAKPAPRPGKTKPVAKPKKAKTHGAKAAPAPAAVANPHAKAGKTTICHSTGSATNPYVQITVSDNALKAHARHHDGRDIVPAPAGGCPSGETAASQPAPNEQAPASAIAGDPPQDTSSAPAVTPAEPGSATEGVATTGPRVLGVSETKGAAPDAGVLGVSASQPAAAGAASGLPAAEPTATRGFAGLPFTGLDLVLILVIGAGALLAGVALRRALAGRTTV